MTKSSGTILDGENRPEGRGAGRWMVIIHLTFVVSGVLWALMDWITSSAEEHGHAE